MVGGVTQTTSGGGSDLGIKLSLSGIARELLDPNALSAILEDVMKFAETRAQGAAPYDTGALRDSIGHEVRGMKGRLFATVDYAEPVEYGHRTRGGTFVSARPFLGPAIDDAFDLLEKRIQRHAETVLRST